MKYTDVLKTISLLNKNLKQEVNNTKITFFYEDCGSYNFVLNFEVPQDNEKENNLIYELYYKPSFYVPFEYENSLSDDELINEIIERSDNEMTKNDVLVYLSNQYNKPIDYDFNFLVSDPLDTLTSEIIISDTPEHASNEIIEIIEQLTSI